MFKFVNNKRIDKYDGSILRRWKGDRLVKVVSNPTVAHLKEFGFKELDDSTPMPVRDGYYYTPHYTDGYTITLSWDEHAVSNDDIDVCV